MALGNAHEGYEYQDLLTCYLILKEILNESDSEFSIDRKENDEDKIDDLTCTNKDGKYKKQIKYSNETVNHTLTKSDISADSTYQLAIDELYNSWLKHPNKANTEFRLCLAWNEPDDTLSGLVKQISGKGTFEKNISKVYQIDGEVLWPDGKQPLASWRRLNEAVKNSKIDRSLFIEFCNCFLIEVGLPKLSLDLYNPGALEKIVLNQVRKLGIGVFPNDHTSPIEFTFAVISIVKRARSKGGVVNTDYIFHKLNIKTDYGSIEQNFPINQAENIRRDSTIKQFVEEIETFDKVLLLGEPGNGKSWFIENLQDYLRKAGIKVIRHYCYTNLDDTLQKERIKLNVFYGNLIADILTVHPELKAKKEERFASNLNELNNLLENICESTVLIIDGLDHIDRVYSYRDYKDIAPQDIAIIEHIGLLKKSEKVRIIISSQSIADLNKIPNFRRKTIPTWTKDDTKFLMNKIEVEDVELAAGLFLSEYLHEKSGANPLYLKYLLEEVKKIDLVTITSLELLPKYSFNLSNYYEYLLSKLEQQHGIPFALAGVNFSLTKQELKEITGLGNYVAQSLDLLSPILRTNFSQNGYIIYHESFRRFLIERLRKNEVSINTVVFKPIIDWFETKDFFSYAKAYRFYFQLLIDCQEFAKTLNYLDFKFVTNSIVNGQPWELIVRNYRYLTQSAIYTKDFSRIILLNEINKILSTTEDNFQQIYSLYIDAVGKLHGFKYVADYLIFDGKPTLPLLDGIKACYLCDENGISAPWDEYIGYFDSKKSIEPDVFKYYIRGLLVLENSKVLHEVAEQIMSKRDLPNDYKKIFAKELSEFPQTGYVDFLKEKSESITSALSDNPPEAVIDPSILELQADEIVGYSSVYSAETTFIVNFLNAVNPHLNNDPFIQRLISKFSGMNWFYNWLIYSLKIRKIYHQQIPTFEQIKDAFLYLQYKTEPFEGEPRTCDIYQLQSFTYESFVYGLKNIKLKEEWDFVIELLVKVSNDTTTSFQGSISGPLSTDKLFKLLLEQVCDENIVRIIEVFERLAVQKEEYHLHSYIAEYHLSLSQLYSIVGNKAKAYENFETGIEYTLAYTFRKDTTLDDVVYGVENIWLLDNETGKKYLKEIKKLVNSVVDHTDGKGTSYYPITWFEKFIRIDFYEASLYLLNDLSSCRYSWVAEKSLINLLVSSNGTVNPIVEFFIASTYPINNSEDFLTFCLHLHDKVKVIDDNLSAVFLATILPKTQIKESNFSNQFIELLQNKLSEEETHVKTDLKVKNTKNRNHNAQRWNVKEGNSRPSLSEMSYPDLNDWLERNTISQTDLLSLFYLFNTFTELNPDIKELIKTVVKCNNRNYDGKVNLDVIFNDNNTTTEIACYYLVCRFVYDSGGWFEKFVNIDAFKKAHLIVGTLANEYLLELLPEHLEITFNSRFSANLIGALIQVGYSHFEIKNMWGKLYEITSYRLPFKEEINWTEILSNELILDQEAIFICILISRTKANTSERYQWVITALSYLFKHDSNKLIKPLKWFLKNHDNFLKSTLLVILQLLQEYCVNNPVYLLNFKDELEAIYPEDFLAIDFILEQLLAISPRFKFPPQDIIYPIQKREIDIFQQLNIRYNMLGRLDIDLEQVFAKYKATARNIHEGTFDLYYNRVHEQMLDNVYPSDYLLELINTGYLWQELKLMSLTQEEVYRSSNLPDLNAIRAQILSLTNRPNDLLRPSAYSDVETHTVPSEVENGWIRIGHYEFELHKESHLKLKTIKSIGGIVFSNKTKHQIPYSSYAFYPFYIWAKKRAKFEIDSTPIFSLIQEDGIEHFRLLWLNPELIVKLNLNVCESMNGLHAFNESNEIVLKFRTWNAEYLGGGYRSSLNEEILSLCGSELIIREDYFEQLCSFFKESPMYCTCKVGS